MENNLNFNIFFQLKTNKFFNDFSYNTLEIISHCAEINRQSTNDLLFIVSFRSFPYQAEFFNRQGTLITNLLLVHCLILLICVHIRTLSANEIEGKSSRCAVELFLGLCGYFFLLDPHTGLKYSCSVVLVMKILGEWL